MTPLVILITDPSVSLDRTARVIELAAKALGPGALMVQHRDKTSPRFKVATDARRLVRFTHDHGALFCLNVIRATNDLDGLAKEVGADAVHAPCDRNRAGLAKNGVTWSSVPVHTDQEAWTADQTTADAMLVSPIYLVPRKGPPRGVGALAVARRYRKRVYALGGITPERAQMCADAGAHGVAVVRALLAAEDPAAVAVALAKPFAPPAEAV